MRPYQNGGKTPKTPSANGGRRTHTKRGGKLAKELNGVKKSLVKAKVTAVKAKQRLTSANKEEMNNLLDQSIALAPESSATPQKLAPKADSKIQAKIKKSVASLKIVEQEIKKRTTRTSARAGNVDTERPATSNGDTVDGKVSYNGNGSTIEIAEEAMEEVAPAKPGFLKRTVSRILNLPSEGINSVPYSDIDTVPDSPAPVVKVPENSQNGGNVSSNSTSSVRSCVIS